MSALNAAEFCCYAEEVVCTGSGLLTTFSPRGRVPLELIRASGGGGSPPMAPGCRDPASIEAGSVGRSRDWPESQLGLVRGAQYPRSWGLRPIEAFDRYATDASSLLLFSRTRSRPTTYALVPTEA